MILVIDGTDDLLVKLGLFGPKQAVNHVFRVERNLSEHLISEIKNFLKKQKLSFQNLEKIGVTPGPGHFSRIRTCVATANALGLALRIPVLGLKRGWKLGNLANPGQVSVKPIYNKAPNITKPKTRLTISPKRLR